MQNICQNISIINRGKSIAEGSVKEIMGKKGNRAVYVAEFNSYDSDMISEIEKLDKVTECNISDDDKKTVSISVEGDSDIGSQLDALQCHTTL